MKKFLFLIAFVGIVLLGNAQKAVKIWETPAILEVPESVLFDDSVIYVSNVKGSPAEKDSNGYISRLTPNGDIIAQHWVTGLHAPKGMAVYGNLLYVADVDRVAVIDRKQGIIVQFIEIPGSKFLNDVTASNQGVVAVSDMIDNTIYLIRNNRFELLVKDSVLQQVNGLYWENENLFAGIANVIYKVDVTTKILQKLIEGTGEIDGLERFTANKFIISDWTGKVQVVSTDSAPVEVLNLAAEKYNAADIDYCIKTKTLFIPTFFGNSLAAYRIE
ncbi:MAG: hypothetical protein WCX31_01920 [Salinivirgaceae bacterium]